MKSIYVLILLSIIITGCSSAPKVDTVATSVAATIAAGQGKTSQQNSPVAVQPTIGIISTNPSKPTVTAAPTRTPKPSATLAPTPTYAQPMILLEFGGSGETVTDDFQLPLCWKAPLFWTVAPNNWGTASLILKQYNKTTGTDPKTLVNEVAMDLGADGLSGVAFSPLKGGTYYFSTDNTDEAWTGRIECHDGVSPVGSGMDVEATGIFVTDNYTLHSCNKSIFNWSVEPNSHGTASLILYLCGTVVNSCQTIVNEVKMDLSGSMTGQSLQAVKAGDYFLASENTLQPWSVTWECKD